MRFFRLFAIGLGAILAALILAAVSLFFVTMGDQGVAETVIDNPDLKSAEIAGVRLHVQTLGPVDTPTIIALHGGPGGDARSLAGLHFLSDDYHVVFYDQRGAGLSERVPAEALTLDGYLAELDAVIDRYAGDEPVILVGHSWGAMLASAYLGEHPDRVSRAVLIEPGFLNAEEARAWFEQSRSYMSGPAFLWQALVTGFESIHVEGDDHAADDYLMGKMSHIFANHPDNPYHCPGQSYFGQDWRFGGLASRTAANTPAADLDRLGGGVRFEGPVLFMAGECNDWIGPELQTKHAVAFENADLAVIEGAGHEMLVTHPEETVAEIRAFLR